MAYNRSLDGVRGVAILLVIFFHYGLVDAGWVGVEIFFVLSGFLITRILLTERTREDELGPFLKRFYIRRSLRIFPVYFAYLLGLALIFIVTGVPDGFSGAWPWLFTYTYNWYCMSSQCVESFTYGHFWSLAVEEQFYLIWPLVVFLLTPRALKRLALGIILLIPLFRFGLANYLLGQGENTATAGGHVYGFTLSQFDGFAFGALVALVNPARVRRPGLIFGVTMGLLVIYGALNFGLRRFEGLPTQLSSFGFPHFSIANFQHVFSYTLIDMATAAGLLFILYSKVKLPLLESEPLVRIGRISYGLYIFHRIIQYVVVRLTAPIDSPLVGPLIFLGYLLVAILFAQLSFNVFEEPWLRLKERLTSSTLATPATN